MKITLINPARIPVLQYGGTERVIWYLGKELVRLGHEVTFLVKSGSSCDFAAIIPIDETKPLITQIPSTCELAHFHTQPPHLETLETPYLVTVHGNRNDLRKMDKNTVFVSKNHAERYQSNSYVHNGLDWEDYNQPNLDGKRKHFHFLGKAAWQVKNVKGAIQIIKQMPGEKLMVMGGNRLNLKMGFRFTLSPKIRFKGMLGGTKKFQILSESKGLVFPVLWHEPFGLAIIESLYYGCPVFGTPYGSLPELVPPTVGFLSNQAAELRQALENWSAYDPEICHAYAVENYNSRKMALEYLTKYELVKKGISLNSTEPCLPELSSRKLLEWRAR